MGVDSRIRVRKPKYVRHRSKYENYYSGSDSGSEIDDDLSSGLYYGKENKISRKPSSSKKISNLGLRKRSSKSNSNSTAWSDSYSDLGTEYVQQHSKNKYSSKSRKSSGAAGYYSSDSDSDIDADRYRFYNDKIYTGDCYSSDSDTCYSLS